MHIIAQSHYYYMLIDIASVDIAHMLIAGILALWQANLSPAARDLIQRLLCDADERLGSHSGATEIKVSSDISVIASIC